VVLIGGCSGDLPPSNVVDKLRVLAVRAEPPEVDPGGTTALDLLIADPKTPAPDGGGPAQPMATWLGCAAPLASVVTLATPCGVDPTKLFTILPCSASNTDPVCFIGNQLTAQYTVPAQALGERVVAVVVTDAGVSVEACLGDVLHPGGPLASSGHCVVAIKQIAIHDPASPTRNHNPALDSFLMEVRPDVPWRDLKNGVVTLPLTPAPPTSSNLLMATCAATAAEVKADRTRESLTLSWYTSAGSLDDRISSFAPPGEAPWLDVLTRWSPPQAATGAVYFWAVIRDDRGGVGFLPDPRAQ
jgi:hypothetical protein